MKRFILFLAACLLCFSPAFSQIRLPRLISDGIVLQRDAKVNIWGWASAGEKISLTFKDKSYAAQADTNGKWMITLPAQPAGGPFEMTLKGQNEITLHNILIGDVWICSGQSNMEQVFSRLKDKYPQVIANSTNTNIRQFIVPNRYAFDGPQSDISSGTWESASPETMVRFTAVGYFFAKDLFDKYNVPIGLIRSAAGGTPAEAWISEEAVKEFPQHYAVAKKFQNKNYPDSIQKAEAAMSKEWFTNIRKNDKGSNETTKWYDPQYDASAWPVMKVPGYWADQGLPGVNGVMWFRKEVNLSASFAEKPIRLQLGNVVDSDSVYVNGVFSGTTGYQYPPRKYDLPAGVFKEGKNVIVVRVINSIGKGGFYVGKPYLLKSGNDTINLAGEWQYQLGVKSEPLQPATFFNYKPTGLYNAMIAPLLNVNMKGVLWYQGESNTARAAEYKKLLPALIADWRKNWRIGDFPFLIVQLANYLPTQEQPGESDWAELREAQLQTLKVPNTALTVAIDIGEWNDIHPLNKEDVGKRLALAAQKIAYHDKQVVDSGPLYKSMKIKGNKIILTFEGKGSGLIAKGGGDLRYFSIAGSNKKFQWAKAKIEGNKVIVWSEAITAPVAVRYAWADNPEGANLYNKEGLPASPFRTDNFDTTK